MPLKQKVLFVYIFYLSFFLHLLIKEQKKVEKWDIKISRNLKHSRNFIALILQLHLICNKNVKESEDFSGGSRFMAGLFVDKKAKNGFYTIHI